MLKTVLMMDELENNQVAEPLEFSDVIFSQYSESCEEDHQHICSVMGSIAQSLKERGHPVSATACCLSTCASLENLVSTSESIPPSKFSFDALLTILSLSLPSVSPALLRKKMEYFSNILTQIHRMISSPGRGSIAADVALIKCVAHMLGIRGTADWNDSAVLYSVLVGFITDSRPEIRKQSHTSLCFVIECLRGTSAQSAANDALIKTFERFLLLAGGSNQEEDGGNTRGAREILYILDALKECLPLMSVKHKNTILSYYKTMLQLRQPLVTKRISDSLNTLCLSSEVGVPPDILLDLLLLVAVNCSTETSADNLTFTARLLSVGMKKIFSLNRQICVVKLPFVFSTLRDIFASERGEAVLASTESLRNLICDCIDVNLIKQGVDQVVAGNSMGSRKSGPTIIEKLCATVESLLEYHYISVWNMVFQVISALFDKLGVYSTYFLRETLKTLADIQKLPDGEFAHKKQLHECLGKALGAIGPEAFLAILPFNLDAADFSEVNVRLFPILKHFTVGARLDFFVETIFDQIKLLKRKIQQHEHHGQVVAARNSEGLVYSLWSLLPSFCNYPLDTAASFKDLEVVIKPVLHEQPETRGVICSALQLLISQNKRILQSDMDSLTSTDSATEKALAHYTSKVAEENLRVLKSSCSNIMSLLARIFKESSHDDGGVLQSTISEFASVADKSVVKNQFLNTMRDLLKFTLDVEASQNSSSVTRIRLFDLSATLVPGLDADGIGVLLNAVKTGFKDSDGLVQKRAYKTLSVVLQKSFACLKSRLEELLKLMIDVMASCHFSAKRYRIDCLYFLIINFFNDKENAEEKWKGYIGSFLTEIILSLKETNKKTRNRAYDLLVKIGHACGDEDSGGKRQNLLDVFEMVCGGLAGDTPQMVSASMKGIARMAYEFSDLLSFTSRLLPFAYKILHSNNREVVKSSLGLLKVLVAKASSEALETELKTMVEALLAWQDGTKDHFKAKVKHIVEMLVGKCGADAVKAVIPEQHLKLLTNIRKVNERKKRKRASLCDESVSRFSKATSSKWNHTRIFSDFNARSSSKFRSKATSVRSKSLPEDVCEDEDEEPLDLLDRKKTRDVLRTTGRPEKRQASDDEFEVDSDGRMIIMHEGKRKKVIDVEETKSMAGSQVSGVSSKSGKKRRRTDGGWSYDGGEYKSKRAGGDVKKDNKLEPYAYWPLDRKMISRRSKHRAAARKGMASVVKLAKTFEGKSAHTALSLTASKFDKLRKKSKR